MFKVGRVQKGNEVRILARPRFSHSSSPKRGGQSGICSIFKGRGVFISHGSFVTK